MTTPQQTLPVWILEEHVNIRPPDEPEDLRWIHRRTFYGSDELAWHLEYEAPTLYNADPVLRVSRVDLPVADRYDVSAGPQDAPQGEAAP